jgi:hypothetical protein
MKKMSTPVLQQRDALQELSFFKRNTKGHEQISKQLLDNSAETTFTPALPPQTGPQQQT